MLSTITSTVASTTSTVASTIIDYTTSTTTELPEEIKTGGDADGINPLWLVGGAGLIAALAVGGTAAAIYARKQAAKQNDAENAENPEEKPLNSNVTHQAEEPVDENIPDVPNTQPPLSVIQEENETTSNDQTEERPLLEQGASASLLNQNTAAVIENLTKLNDHTNELHTVISKGFAIFGTNSTEVNTQRFNDSVEMTVYSRAGDIITTDVINSFIESSEALEEMVDTTGSLSPTADLSDMS